MFSHFEGSSSAAYLSDSTLIFPFSLIVFISQRYVDDPSLGVLSSCVAVYVSCGFFHLEFVLELSIC